MTGTGLDEEPLSSSTTENERIHGEKLMKFEDATCECGGIIFKIYWELKNDEEDLDDYLNSMIITCVSCGRTFKDTLPMPIPRD